MEIVIENPGAEAHPGLSIVTTAVTPTAGATFACCESENLAATTLHSPTHFAGRRAYPAGTTVLQAQSHYSRQRDRYPLTSYDDPGGFAPPPLVRHFDRSGLSPGVSAPEDFACLGSYPFNDELHLSPLRVDASGLLGAVRDPDRRSPCSNSDFQVDATEMSILEPGISETGISESQGKLSKPMFATRPIDVDGHCMETDLNQEHRGSVLRAEAPSGGSPISASVVRGSPFRFHVNPTASIDAIASSRQSATETSSVKPCPGEAQVLGTDYMENPRRVSFHRSAGTDTKAAITTTTTMTSTTTTTMTTKADDAGLKRDEETGRCSGDAVENMANGDEVVEGFPEEERAEAEGCENQGTKNFTEDAVSSKGSNVFLDNDAIQTLRVIILSEQL